MSFAAVVFILPNRGHPVMDDDQVVSRVAGARFQGVAVKVKSLLGVRSDPVGDVILA
jgi:hypothetical protein